MIERSTFSTFGAVGSAFAASLCCTGPLLYVGLGVGGAGLASAMEPLRPWFLGLTAVLLGLGFYTVYGPGPRCVGEGGERRVRRRRVTLWIGTALVVGFATFPTWSAWLL